jgi:hypothetical protein
VWLVLYSFWDVDRCECIFAGAKLPIDNGCVIHTPTCTGSDTARKAVEIGFGKSYRFAFLHPSLLPPSSTRPSCLITTLTLYKPQNATSGSPFPLRTPHPLTAHSAAQYYALARHLRISPPLQQQHAAIGLNSRATAAQIRIVGAMLRGT